MSTIHGGEGALDEYDTYQVTLKRPRGSVYGLAYRVTPQRQVIVTNLLSNSCVDAWNSSCDVESTICVGDRIVTVNEKSDPEQMLTDLQGADAATIIFVKAGPRWHIKGITASCIEKAQTAAGMGLLVELKNADSMFSSETAEEEIGATPWQYLLIFCVVSLPNLFLVAFFSDMGFGFAVYKVLAPGSCNLAGNMMIASATLVSITLYVVDWRLWKNRRQKILTALIVVYASMIGAFLKSRLYPQVPLVASLLHVPVFIGMLRMSVLRRVNRGSFYKAVSMSLIVVAFVTLTTWLLWMLSGEDGNIGWRGKHTWTDATKRILVEDADPIYKEFTLSISGQKRRTHYDMDCDKRTSTDQICTEDHCKRVTTNLAQLMQTVRHKRGVYCCTSSEACDAGHQCPSTLTAVATNAASYDVYKVEGAVLCCSRTEKMSKEDIKRKVETCAKAKTAWFLVWMTPLAAFGVNLVMAVFCVAHGVYLNTTDVSRLEKTMKHFVLMVITLLLMMWISTAIAGASMRLTGTLLAFCVSGLVLLFLWIYLEVGTKAINMSLRSSHFMQSIVGLATSDWVRAIVLIGLNMLIPVVLFLDALNQAARRRRGTTQNDCKFTYGMYYYLDCVKKWNWASILIKVNWLCLLYWVLSIGVAKLTLVFMAWLNEELLKIDMGSVVVIFFVIGFVMFLLPPVPGIPVYMSSGVVLSARARNLEIGFLGGTIIAIFVSFVLKLTACVGQYMIGYTMGKSVKVQQMVGVDKVFTRAIQQILEKPGMPVSKVAVLLGGPDWPTSVLCGILKLNLMQILVGTCPIILISTPVVLSGSFMATPHESNPDDAETGIWDTLTPVMIGISFMAQLTSAILAVYYIQEVMHRDGPELSKPRKEHEAVAEFTKAEAVYAASYLEALDWNTLEIKKKAPLLLSTFGLLLSNFCFVFLDEACFHTFKLTDKIEDEQGLDGNVLSLIKLPGIVLHVLFFICLVLHITLLHQMARAARINVEQKRKELDKPVSD